MDDTEENGEKVSGWGEPVRGGSVGQQGRRNREANRLQVASGG